MNWNRRIAGVALTCLLVQIGTAGGHYLWTVKANQPQLFQDLHDWFDTEVELIPGMGCPAKDFRSATVTNKDHGRIEVRTLTASSQLNDFLDWPFLQQVFRLERRVTVQKTGLIRCQVAYGITSLPADKAAPEKLLHRLRSYWRIENGLHYRRDVFLREDQTRFKKLRAAHNMAIINNLVLAVIAQANFRSLERAAPGAYWAEYAPATGVLSPVLLTVSCTHSKPHSDQGQANGLNWDDECLFCRGISAALPAYNILG